MKEFVIRGILEDELKTASIASSITSKAFGKVNIGSGWKCKVNLQKEVFKFITVKFFFAFVLVVLMTRNDYFWERWRSNSTCSLLQIDNK